MENFDEFRNSTEILNMFNKMELLLRNKLNMIIDAVKSKLEHVKEKYLSEKLYATSSTIHIRQSQWKNVKYIKKALERIVST